MSENPHPALRTKEKIDKGWAWLDNNYKNEIYFLDKRFDLKKIAKMKLINIYLMGYFNNIFGP